VICFFEFPSEISVSLGQMWNNSRRRSFEI
jgi:hypothetical protein